MPLFYVTSLSKHCETLNFKTEIDVFVKYLAAFYSRIPFNFQNSIFLV